MKLRNDGTARVISVLCGISVVDMQKQLEVKKSPNNLIQRMHFGQVTKNLKSVATVSKRISSSYHAGISYSRENGSLYRRVGI